MIELLFSTYTFLSVQTSEVVFGCCALILPLPHFHLLQKSTFSSQTFAPDQPITKSNCQFFFPNASILITVSEQSIISLSRHTIAWKIKIEKSAFTVTVTIDLIQ